MIIKKFQGKNEEEALAQAKKELGDNIVVMSARVVKKTGLFAFLKKPSFEITVGKEEESEIRKREDDSIKQAVSSIDRLRASSEDASRESSSIADPSSSKTLEKLDNIQNLLELKLARNEERASYKEISQLAVGDTDESRQPAPKPTIDKEENNMLMDFVKVLYNTMVENEVSQQNANQMIDEIEKNFKSDAELENILSYIYQKMILKFGKPKTITPSDRKGPKIVYFIGPTGVGKTTTLAKIASLLSVLDTKKVALFTADTYRIAATEQLRTYASILEAPFHIIYNEEDMLDNFAKYKDYDYILVDTAGHSHTSAHQLEETGKFIHLLDDKWDTEIYLVLSATTKYRDLVSIADAYSDIAKYKLIFTKLDETFTYGNMLNLRIHTQAPMSYITNGQNVPDDIGLFDPQAIVKQLLGGDI